MNGSLIARGLVMMAIGIGVTAATYSAASGGGTYIMAWGPIVYGFITLIRGLGDSSPR